MYAKFYKEVQDKKNFKYEIEGWKIYEPFKEFIRQGVEFSDNKFCLSSINNNYELCETYPSILIIPTKFSNNELFQISQNRMKNRIPVLTYFYNGLKGGVKSYLYRSAQIKKGGIIFKSKNLEVEYINTIMNIENNNNGFIIFDCRTEFNAKANTVIPVSVPPVFPNIGKSGANTRKPFSVNFGINLKKFVPRPSLP